MEDLNEEQIAMLRKAFDGFDREGEGHIKVDMVGSILRMMGQTYNAQTLRDLMTEFDPEGKGTLKFEVFAALAARFFDDDTDDAELAKELKEAFRLYDKEGNGFIPTSSLNEILKELDDTLSDEDRKNIIDEVDADGSGTLDFDEFMEMMTG